MATGVVSLCFHTTGPQWLSRSLFAVAAVVWAVLMAVVIVRVFTDRPRWADEAGAASSLTLAAGTAVLGSRLAAAGGTGPATGLSVFHESALHRTGRALSWLALAVWTLVAGASLVHVRTLLRKGRLLVNDTPPTSR